MLLAALLALFLAPAIASAKLPFFGLEVDPLHPRVGEPITLTMTCYDDMDHTQPWSACLGAGGKMAWVHPLDDEGRLDRDDWIAIEGHATSSDATRGHITLNEPGAYDVLPLWRTWGSDAGDGFPDVIRIEVKDGKRIFLTALVAFGIAGPCLALAAWRSRTSPTSITP
jgi:hypothetical protein